MWIRKERYKALKQLAKDNERDAETFREHKRKLQTCSAIYFEDYVFADSELWRGIYYDMIKRNEAIRKALELAWQYGQIDGDHHKTWVIDQMVRALCGSDEEYNKWVEAYETPDGQDYYEWDTGIAP